MLVCVVSMLVMRDNSIYEKQVKGRFDSQAHFGDFVIDVLEGITVDELAAKGEKPLLVPEDMPLPMILRLVSDAKCAYFPLVDRNGDMCGIFSLNDIRRILNEDLPAGLIIARDLATQEVIFATPNDHLTEVMKKITAHNLEEIPVVESENPRRVQYMLTRRALLAHYAEEVEKTRVLYQQN